MTDPNSGTTTVVAVSEQSAPPTTIASVERPVDKPTNAPSINDWAKVHTVANAEEGMVGALMVDRVAEDSPYYRAGLRNSMQIVGYQRMPGDCWEEYNPSPWMFGDLYLAVLIPDGCEPDIKALLRVDANDIREALTPQPKVPAPTAPTEPVATDELQQQPATPVNVVAAAEPREQ